MDRMTDETLKAVAKVFDGAKSAENSLRMYALHQDESREERLLLKRDVESRLSNVLRAVESNGPFFKEMDFEKFKAVMKIAGRRVDAVSIPPDSRIARNRRWRASFATQETGMNIPSKPALTKRKANGTMKGTGISPTGSAWSSLLNCSTPFLAY